MARFPDMMIGIAADGTAVHGRDGAGVTRFQYSQSVPIAC
jgi:hypothetical protein